MNSKKSRLVVTIILSGVLVLTIGCTALKKPGTNQPTPNQGQTEIFPNQPPGAGGQRLSTTPANDNNNASGIQRANRITQQLMTIGNIRRAPVLIDGTTAIVGVDFIDKNNNVIMDRLVNFNNNNMKSRLMLPQTPNNNTNANNMSVNNTGTNTGVNDSRQTDLPGTRTQIGLKQNDGTNNNIMNNNTNPKDAISSIVRSLDGDIKNVLVTTEGAVIDRIQKLASGMTNEMNDITKRIQGNNKR